MERRIWAAFKKQWQDRDIKIAVTSPQITHEEHFNENIPKDLFINVMVGDLQRIKEYPKQGFQVEQKIPDDVWHAYEELVKLGYTQFLMK
jgi:wobble nucleotide-excising tRNase